MDGILSEQTQPSLVWQLFKYICWLMVSICAWEFWLHKLVFSNAGQGAHAAVLQLQ
jgi:hypothetical protein